jgi:hypothetical protein
VLVPLLVSSFLAIRHYYARGRILHLPAAASTTAEVVIMPILSHLAAPVGPPLQQPGAPQPVPAMRGHTPRAQAQQQRWRRVVQQELAFAARIAPALVVVRVVNDQEEAEAFRVTWERVVAEQAPGRFSSIQVEALISPYRTIVRPLANFVAWQARTELAGKAVAVLLPREVGVRWWEWPLQRRVGQQVRAHLEQDQSGVTLIDVPYALAAQRPTT